jgi:hypothetical protein
MKNLRKNKQYQMTDRYDREKRVPNICFRL